MKFYSILFVLISFCFASSLKAQYLSEESKYNLKVLLEDIISNDRTKEERISKFLQNIRSNDKTNIYNHLKKNYQLFDVQNNQPLYRKNYNADAAIAMGVNDVRAGGSLGLNLSGNNLNIGIWDGGLIRTTHSEFEGRIKYFDSAASSEFSNHATGVAGTLLGSGINPSSKGMAPDATGIAYNFIDDTQEMVEAQLLREILISNHSYGLVTGWSDGQWFGDSDISEEEDWRFGFYDSNAKTWDDIAYASPYYLMVKSAGNDRGESGSGSHPADGPYDCVAGASTSKNIMIVGAVEKSSTGYDNPQNIRMSSFSGWGPTDDGRIKPDIVSIGVDIFTAGAEDNTDYQSTNGTSFSSPAACGGLLLLQELYQKSNNSFLKAASLKNLAIHTAKQTGSEGPDYRFGWGLLDVKHAAEFIQNRNNVDRQIIESTIINGESVSYNIDPKDASSARFTLVWTDPSGNPVSRSLDPTDLMLVNDLDLRLTDENGNEFLPYILDPDNPSIKASTGDNFRDNVEQVYAGQLEERNYTLTVTHKSNLSTPTQDFSLIIEYESANNSLTNMYWINNTGDWSDVSQWSFSSGGLSAGTEPSDINKVIIDDNSFIDNSIIVLNEDVNIGSISLFSDKNLEINLNGYTLRINGNTNLNSENLILKNGMIELTSDIDNSFILNLNNTITEDLNITILDANKAEWDIRNSNIDIDEFKILGGQLNIVNVQASFQDFKGGINDNMQYTEVAISGNTALSIYNNLDISDLDEFVSEDSIETIFGVDSDTTSVNLGNYSLSGMVTLQNARLSIIANNAYFSSIRQIDSNLELIGSYEINELDVSAGSSIYLGQDDNLKILNRIDLSGSSNNPIMLSSRNNDKAELFIEYRDKLCFDFLEINNVDLEGNASVSIGLNSLVNNSSGWAEVECSDLLFSDFELEYACSKALTKFIDISQGKATQWEWTIDNDIVSNSQNYEHTFDLAGEYNIGLNIHDIQGNESRFSEIVEIQETALDSNYIIMSTPDLLASVKLADAYQWYKNGEVIPTATSRTYLFNGEVADYCVVTFKGDCNRKSAELKLLTNTEEVENINPHVSIYPNPVLNELHIQMFDQEFHFEKLEIIDAAGNRVIFSTQINNDSQLLLDISGIPAGFYFLMLHAKNGIFKFKLIKI